MESEVEVHWFEFGPPDTDIPAWKRTAGVAQEGRIFVPAAMAGNEDEVHRCTMYDGTPTATYHGHIFVPADWLSKEFPDTKEMCDVVRAAMRRTISLPEV